MYDICNIVYGCERKGLLQTWECEAENEDIGFVGLYSGSGGMPAYCGVLLKAIGPVQKGKHPKDFDVKPTPAQKKEAIGLLAEARVKLKAFIEKLIEDDEEISEEEEAELMACIPETPEIVLVWSTS